eukprot:CAMPEP_0180011162 /NCGR_PEP_ID=MMETSP0984-20121128/16195_1 /TAXON_ID=483367 /ORGANISM="non described non described, Strain CCMP 2436" /LENGTH=71 /DNA_ID=CAMNT_0021933149 /DNA_START=141 /DNA_END=352 /DNA_ORIENTATION=+
MPFWLGGGGAAEHWRRAAERASRRLLAERAKARDGPGGRLAERAPAPGLREPRRAGSGCAEDAAAPAERGR